MADYLVIGENEAGDYPVVVDLVRNVQSLREAMQQLSAVDIAESDGTVVVYRVAAEPKTVRFSFDTVRRFEIIK